MIPRTLRRAPSEARFSWVARRQALFGDAGGGLAKLLIARRGSLVRLLLSLFALVLLGWAHPQYARAADIPTLQLRTGEDPGTVARYIRYIKQPGAADMPDLGSILEAPLQRIEGPTIHFGPPGQRTVVLLKLRNVSASQGSWILTTGRGSLKHLRLYEAEGDQLTLLVNSSDPADARANLATYQAFSTEVVLDSAQEKLMVIEFLSENSTYMPLKVETWGTFFKDRRANIAMVAAVVVGALTLLLLNFLFFSITGFKEFLWLAVAEFFFALNTVHSEGYITIFFLYDKPLTGVAVEDFIKCGFAAAMAQFARSFLKTAKLFPRRDLALRGLIVASAAIMLLQPGLALYPAEARFALHLATWLVTIAVALFLPFVGWAAMKQLGVQLWPLFVGWGSLALFIIYAAVASMGIFSWLPINWHLAGPVGLFEAVMVTLALGLNLKKIQHDKVMADANYARSLSEQLATSEQTKRLAEEKAFALETIHSQNALLHASGHDSRQVIVALNSAVAVLKAGERSGEDEALVEMLQSSADYLNGIVSTTMSGANIAASNSPFVALSNFPAEALLEPLAMMFKGPFANKQLTLVIENHVPARIVSDKPLLMRALANLLGNSLKFTARGGARVGVRLSGDSTVIELSDSGPGMPEHLVAALNEGKASRLRADDNAPGTGSGFGAARGIVERLGGSLTIVSSDETGTVVELVLPGAFSKITPISMQEAGTHLPNWSWLDFDQRGSFDTALREGSGADRSAIAVTYDDSTVTRGRLNELVAMMAIKPVSAELLEHPLLRGR